MKKGPSRRIFNSKFVCCCKLQKVSSMQLQIPVISPLSPAQMTTLHSRDSGVTIAWGNKTCDLAQTTENAIGLVFKYCGKLCCCSKGNL